MNTEEIVDRGRRAALVLGNPEIMGTLEELKADLLSGWMNSDPEQTAAREALYFQQLGLQNLISYLQTYIQAAEQIAASTPDEE